MSGDGLIRAMAAAQKTRDRKPRGWHLVSSDNQTWAKVRAVDVERAIMGAGHTLADAMKFVRSKATWHTESGCRYEYRAPT